MEPRLNYFQTAPKLLNAVVELEKAIRESGFDRKLLHLVKLRASQINGCSWCVDMHAFEAREDGETEQRLYLVSAWREAPMFTDRERAALAWTEAVTLISHGGVSDELYAEARKHFSEEELVQLTTAVGAINMWNRFNVAFHGVPKERKQKAA